MNPLVSASSWLSIGGWERLAFDALWQSTALAGGGLLMAWLAGRRAALRAAILLAATILSIAVPVLSCAVRATGGGLLPAPSETPQLVLKPVQVRPAIQAPQLPPAEEPPAKELPSVEPRVVDDVAALEPAPAPAEIQLGAAEKEVAAPPRSLRPLLAWFWLAMSLLLAWQLGRGWLALRRAIRTAEPCRDPAIDAALSQAAEKLSVCPPEILSSPAFQTPALAGLWRPRLLVPPQMPKGVDWFAIFCHELAHLARRDGLGRLAVELCLAVLPWQPLLWLVRRQFRSACEEACDDWAVACGANPLDLASLLVELVPQRQPSLALGMAESPAATKRRVLRLLAMKGAVRPQLGLALGILGWMLAVGLGVALAMLQYGRHGQLDAGPPPWGDQPLDEAIARAAAALPKTVGRPAPYVIQPPDILQLSLVKLVPRPLYHLESGDVLTIQVANPLIDQPIAGDYTIDADGEVSLGPAYGSIKVSGLTLQQAREAVLLQLSHVLRDPQISLTLEKISSLPPLAGQRMVAPDGTINLGSYGIVYVAGKTIGQATEAIEAQLSKKLHYPQVSLDVFAYNSKTYYLIVEDRGEDHLVRVSFTGGETVLDALAKGMADRRLGDLSDYWVWVARPLDTSPALPQPSSKRDVFATSDGTVEEVLVEHGQKVKEGDVLVRLRDTDLEVSILDLTSQLAQVREKIRAVKAELADHPGEGPPVEESPTAESADAEEFPEPEVRPGLTIDADAADEPMPPSDSTDPKPDPRQELSNLVQTEDWYKSQLAVLEKKRERLMITSPIDGRVATFLLHEQLLHRPVKQGQVLMTIAEDDGSGETAVRAPQPAGSRDQILPVDWQKVVEGTDTTSNWRILAGDRIFIRRRSSSPAPATYHEAAPAFESSQPPALPPTGKNQTSITRTIGEHEAHFQLRGGRIAYVPFNEFIHELRSIFKQTTHKLRDQDEITETYGPIDDFTVRYTIGKGEISSEEVAKTGHGGAYIQLSEFHFYPLSADIGEPVAEAMNRASMFRDKLNELDSKRYTITLWVYPDSLGDVDRVRQELGQLGYQVAVRQISEGRPIGGSPSSGNSAPLRDGAAPPEAGPDSSEQPEKMFTYAAAFQTYQNKPSQTPTLEQRAVTRRQGVVRPRQSAETQSASSEDLKDLFPEAEPNQSGDSPTGFGRLEVELETTRDVRKKLQGRLAVATQSLRELKAIEAAKDGELAEIASELGHDKLMQGITMKRQYFESLRSELATLDQKFERLVLSYARELRKPWESDDPEASSDWPHRGFAGDTEELDKIVKGLKLLFAGRNGLIKRLADARSELLALEREDPAVDPEAHVMRRQAMLQIRSLQQELAAGEVGIDIGVGQLLGEPESFDPAIRRQGADAMLENLDVSAENGFPDADPAETSDRTSAP